MSQAFPQPKAAGNQLLAAYSRNLIEVSVCSTGIAAMPQVSNFGIQRPIRTKAITSGTLL